MQKNLEKVYIPRTDTGHPIKTTPPRPEASIAGTNKEGTPLTYADAGVDIDAGDALVVGMRGDAARTARPGSDTSLGGFGASFDLKAAGFRDPVLVAGADGVGTKLELARATGNHRGLGVDLVAMCANDILAHGAMPLFFLDYFAAGRLDPAIASTVVAGIADGCVEAGCALSGGETAEMPGVYPQGGFDLAGFCIGAVERGQHIDTAKAGAGDCAIAVASSGPHSNGFSLIRKVMERAGLDPGSPAPFDEGRSLGEVLLEPTRIYVKAFSAVLEAVGGVGTIHGIAHITGGGLIENPPRAFGNHLKLELDLATWVLPPVFRWLRKVGNIEALELARVFNCGIGLLIFTPPEAAEGAVTALGRAGYESWVAGRLADRGTDMDQVTLVPLEAWD